MGGDDGAIGSEIALIKAAVLGMKAQSLQRAEAALIDLGTLVHDLESRFLKQRNEFAFAQPVMKGDFILPEDAPREIAEFEKVDAGDVGIDAGCSGRTSL